MTAGMTALYMPPRHEALPYGRMNNEYEYFQLRIFRIDIHVQNDRKINVGLYTIHN